MPSQHTSVSALKPTEETDLCSFVHFYQDFKKGASARRTLQNAQRIGWKQHSICYDGKYNSKPEKLVHSKL